MAKSNDDLELTDDELAFAMIELTCDEMDSLARTFTMISDLCRELESDISLFPERVEKYELN